MIRGLAVLCLLPSVILGYPRVRRESEPDPEPVLPVVYSGPLAHPLVYHAPNCTTVEETITLKKCTPKTEKVCGEVEVPVQKIEFEEVCNNVTTVVCTPVIPEVKAEAEKEEEATEEAGETEEAAEVVKRAADPQLLAAPFHPLPHVPLLYAQNCEDKVEEQCIKSPVVKTETTTVESCKIVTTPECEDVEQKVPRTTCTHTQHVVY